MIDKFGAGKWCDGKGDWMMMWDGAFADERMGKRDTETVRKCV